MKSNAAKSKQSTARKSASSRTRSRRPTVVPENSLSSNSESETAQLDATIDRTEDTTVEGQAGDRILEATGIDSGEPRTAIPEPELKSETSCVFEEEKLVVAIDAFGNAKTDRPSDADTGEVQHAVEDSGQLNLLEWDSNEPPEPDDFPGDLAGFKEAYLVWVEIQEDTAEEELSHISAKEVWETSTNGTGLTCAAALVPVSHSQESSNGDAAPIFSVNGTNTPTKLSDNDSPTDSNSVISKPWDSTSLNLKSPSISSPQALLVNPLALTGSDSQQQTIETASPQSLPQSNNCNPNLQSLKTSQDWLTVPTPPAINQEATLGLSSTPYPRSGMTQNGNVFLQPTLEHPGVEKESLLLRGPGALSGNANKRPPGQTRLDDQLKKLWLIQEGEVINPEFLEAGYTLPTGWTNPEETRTAIELNQIQAQQLEIDPNLELPAETEPIETDAQHLETPLTGELQVLPSNELNISINLPANIGALNKAELISMAQEQHQLICVIERKEFELAIEKLHRVRLTGVYLQEFKKKCQYGEFENQLEQSGIGVRSAQNYMMIAKNWEIVEAKTQLVALLTEENQPAIGLKWALEIVRDEKKALKSAAPPADPDCWRTPNTKEQPIIDLVTEALGGEIWCDPCADAGHCVPARVHYNTSNSGLNARNLWTKTVFINPPFSDPLPWVDKCCDSIARGDCSQTIMLLKAGTLSNQGTGELINKYASGICHWRGRINFLNDNDIAVKGSDFDCVLIYFGDRFDRFQQVFKTFGTVSFIENHYSTVNKRQPAVKSVAEESKQLAAAVGLSNGRSILPDLRDSDRELMEQCDPYSVDDRPFAIGATVEMTRSEPLAMNKSETAEQKCLKDYIIAINSNLSSFSDEQVGFLAKIINEESAKRICGF